MIRRFKLFLIAAMLLPTTLLSGCIPLSLHPIYTGKDVVFDAALVGNWDITDSRDSWTITRNGQTHYKLVYTDEDHKQGEFVAHLVKVKGTLFLDLFPVATKSSQNYFYAVHLLPVHSLFQVIRTKPTPQLAVLSEDWLRKYRVRHPSAIRYEEVNGNIYLTGSPREMQRFLVAHLKTKGAFALVAPWRRKPQ